LNIKKQESRRTTTTTIIITGIVIFTMLTFVTVASPKPARAVVPFCNTCMPHESITGNGLDDLICSSGITYPNTQVKFNALVTIKVPGPAKGTVTLTATTASQIQGTITSGAYDPSMKTYFISGTSTSDNLCGVPGSPFTISGPTGTSVPISMTGKYDFKGTGDVTASPAKA
jgi:hypothetical protein